MKITLSKKQWELIGKKTGWLKKAQNECWYMDVPISVEGKNYKLKIFDECVDEDSPDYESYYIVDCVSDYEIDDGYPNASFTIANFSDVKKYNKNQEVPLSKEEFDKIQTYFGTLNGSNCSLLEKIEKEIMEEDREPEDFSDLIIEEFNRYDRY